MNIVMTFWSVYTGFTGKLLNKNMTWTLIRKFYKVAFLAVMLKRRPCRLQTAQTVQTVQTEDFLKIFIILNVSFLFIFSPKSFLACDMLENKGKAKIGI